MRKLRLDVELLDVQSFNAGGIQPADLRHALTSNDPCDDPNFTTVGCEDYAVQGYEAEPSHKFACVRTHGLPTGECCRGPRALGTKGCDCYGSERCFWTERGRECEASGRRC